MVYFLVITQPLKGIITPEICHRIPIIILNDHLKSYFQYRLWHILHYFWHDYHFFDYSRVINRGNNHETFLHNYFLKFRLNPITTQHNQMFIMPPIIQYNSRNFMEYFLVIPQPLKGIILPTNTIIILDGHSSSDCPISHQIFNTRFLT